MPGVLIRRAVPRDAERLPAVERSAAGIFASIPEVAWIAESGVVSAKEHKRNIRDGLPVWVAEVEEGRLAGFLIAESTGRELHIWEVAVGAEDQRRGIGSGLIAAATRFTEEERLAALTLTTFRDVPWNAPFYARLGFAILADDAAGERLRHILKKERRTITGLPRCAMRKEVGGDRR